jgi:hypothetical protein
MLIKLIREEIYMSIESIGGSFGASMSGNKAVSSFYARLNQLKMDVAQPAVSKSLPQSVPKMISILQEVDQGDNFLANFDTLLSKMKVLGKDCPEMMDSLAESRQIASVERGMDVEEVIDARQKKVFKSINSDAADLLVKISNKLKELMVNGVEGASFNLESTDVTELKAMLKAMLASGGGIESLSELSMVMKIMGQLGSHVSVSLISKLEDALSDFVQSTVDKKTSLLDKLAFLSIVTDLISSAPVSLDAGAKQMKDDLEIVASQQSDSAMLDGIDVEDVEGIMEGEEEEATEVREMFSDLEDGIEERKDTVRKQLNVENKKKKVGRGGVDFGAGQRKAFSVQRIHGIVKKGDSGMERQGGRYSKGKMEGFRNITDPQKKEGVGRVIGKMKEAVEKMKSPVIEGILDALHNVYYDALNNEAGKLEDMMDSMTGA